MNKSEKRAASLHGGVNHVNDRITEQRPLKVKIENQLVCLLSLLTQRPVWNFPDERAEVRRHRSFTVDAEDFTPPPTQQQEQGRQSRKMASRISLCL